jgi:hypothetical protein
MFELATDVNIGFFAFLNQFPLGLTLFLHTIIVLPMFWIYKQEKARLESESE